MFLDWRIDITHAGLCVPDFLYAIQKSLLCPVDIHEFVLHSKQKPPQTETNLNSLWRLESSALSTVTAESFATSVTIHHSEKPLVMLCWFDDI